jgi:hypothetical protein
MIKIISYLMCPNGCGKMQLVHDNLCRCPKCGCEGSLTKLQTDFIHNVDGIQVVEEIDDLPAPSKNISLQAVSVRGK